MIRMKKIYYFKLFLFGLLFATLLNSCDSDDNEDDDVSSSFSFVKPEDSMPILFEYGETKTVQLNLENIESIENISTIKGWTVTIDVLGKTATITAPKLDNDLANTYGEIILKGKSKKGQENSSELSVCTFDYANPWGTFFVIEGNMSSENGDLAYLDMRMKEYNSVYKTANNKECGNVLQDMYIADGKVYLLSQNGSSLGGAERLVVTNSRTMKNEFSNALTVSGKSSAWPQHLVVANNKVFIQFSYDTEQSSGIRVFDLATKTLSTDDIAGTSGAFTKEGALKGRMILSRNKIFAGLGNAVVIINPNTSKVEKTVDFSDKNRQVKGIVKAADNNIYVALSGEFTGSAYSPEFTSNPSIVCIDHNGNVISEKSLPAGVIFPAEPWSPSINLCASFTQDYLFFNSDNSFGSKLLARYNYKSGTIDNPFITANDGLYGYAGVHPFTEDLYVGMSVNYMSTLINKYSLKSPSVVSQEYSYSIASPAGIDFAYRFTDDFINR